MAYKSFFIRSGGSGWGQGEGHSITLSGFFGSESAPSFRGKTFVVLCDNPEKGSLRRYPEYLYVRTTAEERQSVAEILEQKRNDPYGHPRLVLTGRGVKSPEFSFADFRYPD